MTSQQEKLLNLLCRRSKLCLARVKTRRGKNYDYRPRSQLLRRLSEELGCSRQQARDELLKLRRFILENPQYFHF